MAWKTSEAVDTRGTQQNYIPNREYVKLGLDVNLTCKQSNAQKYQRSFTETDRGWMSLVPTRID
jgi:hypothetical protein